MNAICNLFLSWTVDMHVPKKGMVSEILSLQKERRIVKNSQAEKSQRSWRVIENSWSGA